MISQDITHFPLLSGFNARQFQRIENLLVPLAFGRGATIFAQGSPACYIYILVKGEVRIDYKPYDGPPLTVARIRPGGVFGWSAALSRDFYSSSALAVEDAQVLRLRSTDLRWLCEHEPQTGNLLLERLAEGIAERLRNTYSEILAILSQAIDPSGDCPDRTEKR